MEEGKREFLEVEVEGKKYLILDSGITDEDFVVPPASIINKVYKFLCSQLRSIPFYDIIAIIKAFYKSKRYDKTLTFIEFLVDNITISPEPIFTLRWLMPVQTHCLRALKRPQQAIEIFEKECKRLADGVPLALVNCSLIEVEKFHLITPYWVTSISGAYCDVGQNDKAQTVIEMADFSDEERENQFFKALIERIYGKKNKEERVSK